MSPASNNLLFVYGTLRKDANHPAHKIYLNQAAFVGYAKVHGDLYMIDYYPGLVTKNMDHWVVGEVYALHQPQDWQRLDVYEACSETCAQPHEYERVERWAEMETGQRILVWTYIFIQAEQQYTRIPSGDFLKLPL